MWQGTVESLHIVAEKSHPMTTVETIHAIPGRGLEGDRYANGKGTYSNKLGEGRQVTLFEQETLEALHRDHGIALEPCETRRNVITRVCRSITWAASDSWSATCCSKACG